MVMNDNGMEFSNDVFFSSAVNCWLMLMIVLKIEFQEHFAGCFDGSRMKFLHLNPRTIPKNRHENCQKTI
jgi:hypothetical protein